MRCGRLREGLPYCSMQHTYILPAPVELADSEVVQVKADPLGTEAKEPCCNLPAA